jgi:hypothetical protein
MRVIAHSHANRRFVLSRRETSSPGFTEYRMPIARESLKSLAADFQLPPDQWANMQSK